MQIAVTVKSQYLAEIAAYGGNYPFVKKACGMILAEGFHCAVVKYQRRARTESGDHSDI